MFYVDSDGTRMADALFSVGSGSPYAYGVLDQGYNWDLSGGLNECVGMYNVISGGGVRACPSCNLPRHLP